MPKPAEATPFPLSRIATYDVGVIGRKKHHITGLLEIDVTTARERLRRLRRNGTPISFTAWAVKSIAITAEQIPEVHGVRAGRRRRVVFQDVDIALMVERVVDNSPVPLPVLLRGCATSSLTEIDSRITGAMTQTVDGAGDYQLGRRRSTLLVELFYRLPQILRVWIIRRIMSNPERRKKMMGTVIVTSVSAGVRIPGWIIPKSIHNLVIGLGSVVRKPRVVHDQVVPRDVLHLTVMFDHDVVDGAPAARFVSRLVKTLETAAELGDS
ncbi:MAG: 2-oxo acid dehydrogenase subunit E2 [Alkalispirochaeta sp.]